MHPREIHAAAEELAGRELLRASLSAGIQGACARFERVRHDVCQTGRDTRPLGIPERFRPVRVPCRRPESR